MSNKPYIVDKVEVVISCSECGKEETHIIEGDILRDTKLRLETLVDEYILYFGWIFDDKIVQAFCSARCQEQYKIEEAFALAEEEDNE